MERVVPHEGGCLFGGRVIRVGKAGDSPVAARGERLDGGAVRGGVVGRVLGEVVDGEECRLGFEAGCFLARLARLVRRQGGAGCQADGNQRDEKL